MHLTSNNHDPVQSHPWHHCPQELRAPPLVVNTFQCQNDNIYGILCLLQLQSVHLAVPTNIFKQPSPDLVERMPLQCIWDTPKYRCCKHASHTTIINRVAYAAGISLLYLSRLTTSSLTWSLPETKRHGITFAGNRDCSGTSTTQEMIYF